MDNKASTAEVATLLNITERWVQRLAQPAELNEDQPIFIRLECGAFDITQVVQAYLKYREKLGPAAEKLIAETEIAQLKAKADDRKDRREESELVYLRDVRTVWQRRASSIRQQCHEWHQRTMDSCNLNPKQRTEQEKEFSEFFNETEKPTH